MTTAIPRNPDRGRFVTAASPGRHAMMSIHDRAGVA